MKILSQLLVQYVMVEKICIDAGENMLFISIQVETHKFRDKSQRCQAVYWLCGMRQANYDTVCLPTVLGIDLAYSVELVYR